MRRSKPTLIDLIRADLERDPRDSRPYDVHDAVLAQDMEWLVAAGYDAQAAEDLNAGADQKR